jgi:hypothetical protein
MKMLETLVPRTWRPAISCKDEPSAHPLYHEFNLLAIGDKQSHGNALSN